MALGELREGHAELRDPVVEHLLHRLPGEMLPEAEARREPAPEVVHRPALARRRHRLLRRAVDCGPAEAVGEARPFGPRVARQDEVRELHGRRPEVLHGHHEVLVEQALVDALHVGEPHQGVVPEGEERLDGVGLAGRHGPERRSRVGHVAAGDDVRVLVPPYPPGGLAELLHPPVGKGGMGVRAELLRLLPGGEALRGAPARSPGRCRGGSRA